MPYSYGMQGAPAVGGGAPGLPKRISVNISEFADRPSSDWLLCDGSFVDAASYPLLASSLGASGVGGEFIDYQLDTVTAGSYFGSVETNLSNVIIAKVNNSTTTFKSINNGVTWVARGVTAAAHDYLYYLGNSVFVAHGTSTTFSRSADNGQNWSAGSGTTLSFGGFASDFNGRVMCVTSDGSNIITRRSSDYAATFTTAGTLSATASVKCCAYAGNDVWLQGRDGASVSTSMYRSTNYGATWSSVVVPDMSVRSIAADFKGLVFAISSGASGSNHQLIKSTDYGATWTLVMGLTSNGGSYGVRTNRNGLWVVNTASNLTSLVSTDNGNSWFPVSHSSIQPIQCVFSNNGLVMVSSSSTTLPIYSYSSLNTNKIRLPSLCSRNDGYKFYIKAR